MSSIRQTKDGLFKSLGDAFDIANDLHNSLDDIINSEFFPQFSKENQQLIRDWKDVCLQVRGGWTSLVALVNQMNGR